MNQSYLVLRGKGEKKIRAAKFLNSTTMEKWDQLFCISTQGQV